MLTVDHNDTRDMDELFPESAYTAWLAADPSRDRIRDLQTWLHSLDNRIELVVRSRSWGDSMTGVWLNIPDSNGSIWTHTAPHWSHSIARVWATA